MTDAAEDELMPLQDRLHAARRLVREAYDKRDAIAEEIAAAEKNRDAGVRPELLMALSTAERAVLAAEAEMKDAEYALAVASEPPVTTVLSRASE